MKIKIMVLTLMASSFAYGGTTTSTIKYVQVLPSSNVFCIKLDTPIENRATCATDDRVGASLTSDGGKAALSVAMAAKAAEKEINVSGSGDCTGSIENIGYIRQL